MNDIDKIKEWLEANYMEDTTGEDPYVYLLNNAFNFSADDSRRSGESTAAFIENLNKLVDMLIFVSRNPATFKEPISFRKRSICTKFYFFFNSFLN